MNPYRKLIMNAALFGVSAFGARFLNFLLTPFYTRVLSSTEYGITDLIIPGRKSHHPTGLHWNR
ncbi:hypothetical protein [uncultured Intestinimonas sp.]|uniref:hypothetical protein n=1 Tax=uncultured Intestinimonas sp. TaxID=1689265 RepID=UPI0025E711D4|nr:hypothetical protein [uncultured Intestinimonas sp.]